MNQMVTEGQLKKHATDEEFDSWFKSLSFYERIEMKKRHLKATKELYKDGYLNALEDFKEWIDEAKKDYPGVTKIFNTETRTVNITLPDEWFIKWFGDSS